MHSSGEGITKKRLTHRTLIHKAKTSTGVVVCTYGGLRSNDFKLLAVDWFVYPFSNVHNIGNLLSYIIRQDHHAGPMPFLTKAIKLETQMHRSHKFANAFEVGIESFSLGLQCKIISLSCGL